MYCKKCGKEIPDDSIYCNHCGANLKEEQNTAVKQENKNEDLATVSVNTGCLKNTGIIVSVITAIIAIVVCCCLFIPLNNDKECYEAGVEAHDALQAIRYYGENHECSPTCPVCHPITWRWEIKKIRMGL